MALIVTNNHEMIDFKPKKDFFVGIDSDGCVFDAMEIKHKECFIPNTVNVWQLQTVSRFAREVHEFVNLYSKWRGLNRWPNIVRTMDLLRDHPGVKRGARVDHEPVGGVGDDELRGEVAALGVEGENLLSGGVDHAHAARVAHDAHVAPRAGRELHDLRGRCHGKASGETGGKGG